MALVRPIVGLAAAYRGQSSCINAEFEPKDWARDPGSKEGIPISFDDADDLSSGGLAGVGTDAQVAGEFVGKGVGPGLDICAYRDVGVRWAVGQGFAVTFVDEEIIIDVIGIIDGYIV